MAFCSYCGNRLPDGFSRCPRCGKENSSFGYQPVQRRPTVYPTGGLIAWSIITLLLCTIPGIVGLVQTCGINNAPTYEMQQQKISSAKTWNTVGTVLGALLVIFAIVGSVM